MFKAYESGQCDMLTADVSQLYALRLKLGKPGEHVILADVISKEPLAPVVRQKDDDWLLLVKWTLFAMINAEELGIDSKNIDEAMKSKKPDVMRFVGTEGDYGEELGLTKDWAARIIRHVGNYGEVYERNVGSGSKLGIPRGLNQLWNAGGILYAPPIRCVSKELKLVMTGPWPVISTLQVSKTWMAGTRPAMTWRIFPSIGGRLVIGSRRSGRPRAPSPAPSPG